MSATIAATIFALPVTVAMALAVLAYRRAAERWTAKDQEEAADHRGQPSQL